VGILTTHHNLEIGGKTKKSKPFLKQFIKNKIDLK
jgi:hypothetical protein